MPQISATVHTNIINAISVISVKEDRSFSETVSRLLESHPLVITETEKLSKCKNHKHPKETIQYTFENPKGKVKI